ncbi:MAG: hypothetical protein RLZZ301_1378 [Bacteroidota bacterium]|jgi:lipid-A-disaccharide synthase
MPEAARVFFVCGEASGDLHAANLVHAWKQLRPTLEVHAWGGDRLVAEGAQLHKHIKALNFMGFIEVLKNIRQIRRNFNELQQLLLQLKPDVLVLVDFPGFNLRMAKWAKAHGFKVLYYISPTVWAWKSKRVFQIQAHTDHLFCILPFEPAFYATYGIDVSYFGHPLIDEIDRFRAAGNQAPIQASKPILALLPGSRPQEVKAKLPIMLEAALGFQDTHAIFIAATSTISPEVYASILNKAEVHLMYQQTYPLLEVADMALVTSGTATLETALFRVPQVVCYKGSALSIWLAKRLVKIRFISLVNLILNKEAVPELIQEHCTAATMKQALHTIAPNTPGRSLQLKAYQELNDTLSQKGCSAQVARAMDTYLSK